MTRLSTNPATIRSQITQSETVLDQYKLQLSQVPSNDALERSILQEQNRKNRLDCHLLGLEREFDVLLEGTVGHYYQFAQQ